MKRAILNELLACHPYLLPEPALLAGVNLRLANPTTLTELRQAAQQLETQGHLTITTNDLDHSRKYRITDSGRAALAS